MKIAIITNTLYEEIIPLAKHLANHVKVDLYSIISGTGAGRQIFFESDHLWKKEKFEIIEDIDHKNYINEAFKYYIDRKFDNYALYFKSLSFIKPKNFCLSYKISSFLKQKKYNLIHFNGTSPLFILLRLFIPDVPFVLTTHDPTPHSGEFNWTNTLVRKIQNRLIDIQHIVHSENIRINFLKRYPNILPEKINVIFYGKHEWLNYWNHQVTSNGNNIIFFGRISPYKGIEYLVEAAKIVRKTIPGLNVYIAGNGKFHFNYESIENDKTFIIINRYIPNDELVDLILRSSLVICPYTDATQSGVIMTSYALNKPVVATSVGGIPEVVIDGKTGKLVPPKNAAALANAIIDLLNDRNTLAKMTENIEKIFVNGKFSWDYIAGQTLAVYEKAIKSHK